MRVRSPSKRCPAEDPVTSVVSYQVHAVAVRVETNEKVLHHFWRSAEIDGMTRPSSVLYTSQVVVLITEVKEQRCRLDTRRVKSPFRS
jgi:hypothetical protein